MTTIPVAQQPENSRILPLPVNAEKNQDTLPTAATTSQIASRTIFSPDKTKNESRCSACNCFGIGLLVLLGVGVLGALPISLLVLYAGATIGQATGAVIVAYLLCLGFWAFLEDSLNTRREWDGALRAWR